MGNSSNDKNREERKTEAERLLREDLKPAKISPFKIAEMCIYLVALILGFMFLYSSAIPISVLLPVYTLCLAAGAVLRFTDLSKNGDRKFISYIPPVLISVLAAALAVVTVMMFTKG